MNDDLLNDLDDGPGGDEMFAGLGHFPTGAIPVDAVLKQGRAIRTRRRLVGGGVLAAAAALTIGVPVAIAGGSGTDTSPAAGHTITVDRPTENPAQQVTFSGSLDGKKWSRTFISHCGQEPKVTGAQCLTRVAGQNKSPVAMLARDEWHKEGDFYSAVLSPGTDYVVLKLNTGDQAVVPGVITDDGAVAAYFQVPRGTTVEQIFAYDKDGREIAHTPPPGRNSPARFDDMEKWYQPGGGDYDISVPTVQVAQGTTGGVPWSIEVTIGVRDRCFSYTIAERPTVAMCPDPGARAYMNNTYAPGVKDGVVLGEVDPGTTQVDVTFKDGTVQHLVPVRSDGHAFVGTYLPAEAAPVSVKPVTGTNS
ncbi:MAG: hypothetical protein HOV83_11825 [Catenulispora sp.]|nr:hypothetical protein [Catenulispora sp.]